ncbi:MAG: DUF2306 domain-containing protein [Pikeienuella sp.]
MPLPANWVLWLALLFVLMWGFLRHSAGLGIAGLIRDLTGISPFYSIEMPIATFLIYMHMVAGAALTVIAPLQLVGPIRRNRPRFHRWSGRVMVVLGLLTGIGGIHYAVMRGTTGGPFMDVSTSVYGILVLLAAVQTYRFGRARRWKEHQRWGWRFSVLVIASWLYRMHYVIWEWVADGAGTTPDMTGPFDKFQAWGFYLSYLAYLEIWFLYEDHRKKRRRRLA